MSKKKIKILIAEDDPSNYRLLEVVLSRDFELVHAWNGEEAVELFLKVAPDLVLMDIKMPIMCGDKAMLEIKKVSATTPVIALTAIAFVDEIDKLLKLGFDDCIVKPVNIKFIIHTIKKWL